MGLHRNESFPYVCASTVDPLTAESPAEPQAVLCCFASEYRDIFFFRSQPSDACGSRRLHVSRARATVTDRRTGCSYWEFFFVVDIHKTSAGTSNFRHASPPLSRVARQLRADGPAVTLNTVKTRPGLLSMLAPVHGRLTILARRSRPGWERRWAGGLPSLPGPLQNAGTGGVLKPRLRGPLEGWLFRRGRPERSSQTRSRLAVQFTRERFISRAASIQRIP